MTQWKKICIALAALMALAACEPVSRGSNQAAEASKKVLYETRSAWSGLLDYNPKDDRVPLPQTRYCYQMQTDIVCYDSPQNNMTAKLLGYQDGTNISWVQPGGGALGVSGGEAISTFNAQAAVTQSMAPMVNTSPLMVDTSPAPQNCIAGGANQPFYCSESPYQQGAVSAAPNPAPAKH
jgi:hypothetical protein